MSKIAISTLQGHVNRAIDFYKSAGKYIIIGGTTPWADDSSPDLPNELDYKLKDVVALKKVDDIKLVVPDENGTISYRQSRWRSVSERIDTITTGSVSSGNTVIPVASVAGLVPGTKIRVDNSYECKIISTEGLLVTVDTPAPKDISSGSSILGGALVEGAKYVYLVAYLEYGTFPVTKKDGTKYSYRQVGLCTGVTPNTPDILRSAEYSSTNSNEYTSLGSLEVLDNRLPATRSTEQQESIGLIIEF